MHADSTVLAYLEASANRTPSAVAVVDAQSSLTYEDLMMRCMRIGTALARMGAQGRSVVIAMEKGCDTVCAMLGSLYAGASYVPIDPEIPTERLEHILHTLNSPLVVVGHKGNERIGLFERLGCTWLLAADLATSDVDADLLDDVRRHALETDPAYILFTSGSTGIPKGVAISHHAIRSFIEVFVPTLGICASDRLANQAPFDFDVSTKDIYSTLATGATLVIVPRELFMQPAALIEYLRQNGATVLIWAVAALCIVSTYHALNSDALRRVRLVAFSGEVMPLRHLRQWQSTLPEASFFNLYGPTEITCNCLYHKLEPTRDYKDGIPLGKAFDHCDVRLIDQDGREVTDPNVEGEIVVRGPSLSLGYVGMPEQTARAFVQNPLNGTIPTLVYRTGDLGLYNEDGELFFRGRRDNQIKYMGHRVELEEIDLVVERIEGVQRCRCFFDEKRKRLYAFYEGTTSVDDIRSVVVGTMPPHMRPSNIIQVDSMPLNKHGKVDRRELFVSNQRKPTNR